MRSIKSPSWIDRLAGLEPLSAPDHVFGVEEDCLRYCRFTREGGIIRLMESRSVDLPEKAFLGGPLGGPPREKEQFREIVTSLIETIPDGIKEASLVLPDQWVRLAFLDFEELPKSREARDEVLRWKLRRVVPFRVEDLRLAHEEILSLPSQEQGSRQLLAFASEALLAALEEVFEAAGIWVGQVMNQALALYSGIRSQLSSDGVAAVALVRPDGYSILLARQGEPILSRFKTTDVDSESPPVSVDRDLRLTRAYLEEHLPAERLTALHLLAEAELEATWRQQLEEVLGQSVSLISPDSLAVEGTAQSMAPVHLLPLAGALRQAIH